MVPTTPNPVRRGQKATGLKRSEMAELPKDEPVASSAFFIEVEPR